MTPPGQGYSWGSQPIARSPMSVGYRIGLAVVSVMMILLPVIYVLLCVAVAVGIYYYAVDTTFLLELKQLGLVAYLCPLIAGVVCLVFMVKPLFAPRRRITAHIEITRDQQPRLFQFIDEVCSRVGAPKPVRVHLDNQVNASASFERGAWGALTGRLVLTIGLPLAQGLTISQFGGVLAHEFGHFTQSAGMRFSFVIRSTNGWFSRVIYERDSFDAHLLAWSKRGNYYSIIIANVARGVVWLARQILWLLMRAGHAVSAYLMRQMEFDADHYEQEVAGAKNFRETFLLMRLMNAGSQMAVQHLNSLWKDGKLVTNVPLLTRRLVGNLSEETVMKVRRDLDEDTSTAPWHATHPADPERIARSAGRPDIGALVGDESATALFANFDAVSEQLTLIDYRERHNLTVNRDSLITTESYLQDNSARNDRLKAMSDFFGGLLHEQRLIFPDAPAGETPPSLDVAQARYLECAANLEQSRDTIAKARQKIEVVRQSRAQALAARMLLGMGIAIRAGNFGLPDLKESTITRVVNESSARIDQLYEELAPALQLAGEKLRYFCQIPGSPEWLARSQDHPDWSAWNQRIFALKSALAAIRPIQDQLDHARKPFFLASVCLENVQAAKDKKWADREFQAAVFELQKMNHEVATLAARLPYPLIDGKTHASLADYFSAGHTQSGSFGQFTFTSSTFERFSHLYTELMLELLEKTTAVEQVCKSHPAGEETAQPAQH